MKTIKHNLGIKITAFVMILALSFVTAGAAINLVTNDYLQNYEKTEALINQEVAWRLLNESAIYVYDHTDLYQYDFDDEAQSLQDVKNAFGSKGVFYNEDKLTNFGYAVYPLYKETDKANKKHHDAKVTKAKHGKYDTDNPIRIINQPLSKLVDDESVFVYYSDHENYRLAVYMGLPLDGEGYLSGEIPEEIMPNYIYYQNVIKYRNVCIGILIGGLILMLVLAIYLIVTMGREVKHIRKIPLDLLTFLSGTAIVSIIAGLGDIFSVPAHYYNWVFMGLATLAVAIFGGTVLLITARMKQPKWWESTIIYQTCRLIKRFTVWFINSFLVKIPLMWKTIVIVLALVIINLFVVLSQSAGVWFVLSVIFFAACIMISLMMRKLQEGGKRIANGDVDYKIDTTNLVGDFRQHANNLNSIADGIEIAVAEQMKAEHMRSELITNVSHDIKTPLTSIINYVDLLKKEMDGDMDETRIEEYLDVLDRQSARLKKLAEDLIEASKAATGNVKLDMAMCNIGMLMNQASSEYEDKAKDAELIIVKDFPKDEVSIMIDGQKTYRVLSNILSNICKYSQPGTRVYETLQETDDKIILTYRNTSKYELNISAEELMERFVRGDSSRHTEGSGLGLSIARNLVELQGGSFDIHIDGDLFKVIIEFKK